MGQNDCNQSDLQEERSVSKESIDMMRKKVSKERTARKDRQTKVIKVPQSVMLGFNPRTVMPWGFDGYDF